MTKKQVILLCALGLAGMLPAVAQLPQTSTDEAPKWYFIQVQGDDSRADRVFTVGTNNKVTGQAMSTSLDLNEVGRQLWRFEKNASGRYTVINRRTGYQLDVAYDDDEGTALAVVSKKSSQTFAFNALDDYYQFELEKAVTSGENWFHQGNSGYDYAIITVGTTYGSGVNSRFHFVPFDDPNITFSDSETETYYHLVNASADYAGQAVRENAPEAGSDADATGTITLAAADDADARSQWRAVKVGKNVRWLNRATGHVLQTDAQPYGLFNILTAGTVVSTGNAWTAAYLGNHQYTFSATGDDKIVRYMGAAADDAAEAPTPDVDRLASSVFAWRPVVVETVATGIDAAPSTSETGPDFRIVGRTVVGRGLKIFTPGGISVPAGRPLDPGIYLVGNGTATVKIVIR